MTGFSDVGISRGHVRSLTFRLFTVKEDACNHCNCGNVKMVFDTFMDWIMQIKQRDRQD